MAQDGSSNGAQEAGRPTGSAAPAWKRDAEQRPPKSASIVETLLQDPVLAAGENIEVYRALVAEVSQEVQPQTLFDRLLVSDLCHAWWGSSGFGASRRHCRWPPASKLCNACWPPTAWKTTQWQSLTTILDRPGRGATRRKLCWIALASPRRPSLRRPASTAC